MTIPLLLSCAFPARSDTTNLIQNGSFETVSTRGFYNEALFWQMGSPNNNGDCWGSAAREDWRSHSGSYIGAIRGLWAGYGSNGGYWQDAKAIPGTTYRFSGWFYCDPEWVARTQEIKIEFLDKDKKSTLHSEVVPITGCDMIWEKISVEATAPEGTAWARVVVNVINTGASGALQLDDLELVKAEKKEE